MRRPREGRQFTTTGYWMTFLEVQMATHYNRGLFTPHRCGENLGFFTTNEDEVTCWCCKNGLQCRTENVSDEEWFATIRSQMRSSFGCDPALASLFLQARMDKQATCRHRWQTSEDGQTCVKCKESR